MTAIGTRRPREGRCEWCDRPLADEVWCDIWGDGTSFGWDTVPASGQCEGSDLCAGPSIDWRARAVAAEARLSVPATSAALDAFRAKRDATHVCEHGSLARKCGDCDGVENGLEAEAWQARALAAEAQLADAEARGRQHGLLVGAWSVTTPRNLTLMVDDDLVDPEVLAPLLTEATTDAAIHVVRDLMALAKEATDGR